MKNHPHIIPDFGARMLDSTTPTWTTPDPLAEKYYNMSPYAYCAGNPILYIDPDGMRVWQINEAGEIIGYLDKNKNFDAIFIVDSNGQTKTDAEGNEMSVKFDYGTITKVEKDVTINGGKASLNMFHVKGDYNAQNIFEFLADPEKTTKVEWSWDAIGTEKSQQNIVGTSKQENHTYQGNYLLNKGYTIRKDEHNHPGNTKASQGDEETMARMIGTNPKTEVKLYRNREYEKVNPKK